MKLRKEAGLQATVVSQETTATYQKLVLRQAQVAELAQPGQFLHVQCGHHQLRRPISIGGVQGDEVTMIFEVKGQGTQWLSQQKPGDQVDVLGPLGHGFPEIAGPVLLVGGGVGVPPVHFVAQRRENCDAVLAFRSADRAMLQEAFQALCGEVLVMSDDGSLGKQGFAAQGVQEMLEKKQYAAVFACGPRIMLKTTCDVCQKAGVPVYVSMEERMGCGIGACLGCSLPLKGPDGTRRMARACADGPVFLGEEVIWDA
jgi:dihydroorotate dehydrogenase electron transfer subunit